MTIIRFEDIQGDPSPILSGIEAGEALTIVRDGRPVAEVRPIGPRDGGARPFGLCRGEFDVPDDFDEPLPEGVIREFEG